MEVRSVLCSFSGAVLAVPPDGFGLENCKRNGDTVERTFAGNNVKLLINIVITYDTESSACEDYRYAFDLHSLGGYYNFDPETGPQ